MLFDQIQESINYINQRISFQPEVGIILGTGLTSIINEMVVDESIPYPEIPHFAKSTVVGHYGQMIIGRYQGKNIVVLSGRVHYYEGYSMKQTTYPVRVLQKLNIQKLIITNISGSVQPHINVGDIVGIKDHINLQSENPLRGIVDERLGTRFPPMVNAYNKDMLALAAKIASEQGITFLQGIYAALDGPSLETRAEYKYLNLIGADLVGMSTVAEVIVANQIGLSVLAMSMVSNKCFPIEDIGDETIEGLLMTVQKNVPKFKSLLQGIVKGMN